MGVSGVLRACLKVGNGSKRLKTISKDRQKAICCVTLTCDYIGSAKSRVAWRVEPTLPKKIPNLLTPKGV
eukprot:6201864-Pleurochrysis_carterae.AAC.1